MTTTTPFHKGHGAGNDFIIVPEQFDPTPEQVEQICDRHFGLGADGLLRVASGSEFATSQATWFMDYRNADGSLAQTCGNGIRVFARYLVEQGLAQRGEFVVGTRGGDVVVQVAVDDLDFTAIVVNMGPVVLAQDETVIGADNHDWSGRPAFMANPHCVVELAADQKFPSLDKQPKYSLTVFPDGVNIEFITEVATNHIAQRTHERGVGETLACGSGACAAAAVYAHNHELGDEWSLTVDLLGGTLVVSQIAGDLHLQGPAQIVAHGTLVLQ
jgi:diaminopimelate epimerase